MQVDKSSPGTDTRKFDFNIKAIYNEAWARTFGVKGTIFGAFLLVLLITCIALFIVYDISNAIEGPTNSAETGGGLRPLAELLKFLATIFILTPLQGGMWMLGVKRSVDMPIQSTSVLRYFSYWSKLAIYPVIFEVIHIIGIIGRNFLIIQMIVLLATVFFAVTYFFFIPLVIDKNLKCWEALETSRKRVFDQWSKYFWFMVLMFFLFLAGLIPAGIGLIWIVPWVNCAMGILYRDNFGVTIAQMPNK